MKKHYTKPTAEPIALHFESMLAESETEIKKHEQKLKDVTEYDDEYGEVEWE